MNEPKRRRGAPSKLNDEVADELARLIAAGYPLDAAAAAAGVSPRTLRSWRWRAWSPRAQDRPRVELERKVQRALVIAELMRQALEPVCRVGRSHRRA